MSVRPIDLPRMALVVVGLGLASGCLEDESRLTRLTDAWAEQTVGVASPAVTGAMVVGALAVGLCVSDAALPAPGDALDIPDMVLDALGDPEVTEVSDIGGAAQVTLSGVAVVDREEATLRYVTSGGGDVDFLFEAVLLDGRVQDEGQPDGESFGRLAFTVASGCQVGDNRVSGTAQWTDLSDRVHAVKVPADESLSAGVGFRDTVPYLPAAGTVSWTGRIDGQERTVASFDAGDISVYEPDDAGSPPWGAWPVAVRGTGWAGEDELHVGPE